MAASSSDIKRFAYCAETMVDWSDVYSILLIAVIQMVSLKGVTTKLKLQKDLIVILAFQSEFSNECIIVIKLFCRIIVIII